MIIRIEKCPRVSETLSELFRQLQLAALFISHFETGPKEPAKTFLDRFGDRPAFLNSILTAIETSMPDRLSSLQVPVISNTARWSDPRILGGYLSVAPRDLLASYLGCWQHSAQYPESAPFRFVRLAFWFWREQGDPFKALMLLFDLHKAGFFLRAQDFGSALFTLCDAYTQKVDIAPLKTIDFRSNAGDKQLLETIRNAAQATHDVDRVHELIDQIEDRALDEADRARAATAADEWSFQQAVLRPVTEVLAHLERQHKPLLSMTQRAIASQFEEIRADIGGEALVTSAISGPHGLPLRLEFLGLAGVGIPYQELYGDAWLDHLMEDRLLVPEALRHVVQKAYEDASLPAVRDLNIPYEWTILSEKMAWPLCVALERNPVLVRSEEFETESVKAMARSLGYQEDEKEIDGFRAEEESEARRQLSINEFKSFFDDESLFGGDSSSAIEKLEAFARLYPWNHFAQRELGIRFDEAGEAALGFQHLQSAVLLEPSEALTWQSLGVVLRRLDEPDDALLASAVGAMLKEKTA